MRSSWRRCSNDDLAHVTCASLARATRARTSRAFMAGMVPSDCIVPGS
jgi:hypothetical protein